MNEKDLDIILKIIDEILLCDTLEEILFLVHELEDFIYFIKKRYN